MSLFPSEKIVRSQLPGKRVWVEKITDRGHVLYYAIKIAGQSGEIARGETKRGAWDNAQMAMEGK